MDRGIRHDRGREWPGDGSRPRATAGSRSFRSALVDAGVAACDVDVVVSAACGRAAIDDTETTGGPGCRSEFGRPLGTQGDLRRRGGLVGVARCRSRALDERGDGRRRPRSRARGARAVQYRGGRSSRRTRWEAAISPSSFDLATPEGLKAAVWSVEARPSPTDALGRLLEQSASRVLREIVKVTSCEGGGHCSPRAAASGRWVVSGCGMHWSTTAPRVVRWSVDPRSPAASTSSGPTSPACRLPRRKSVVRIAHPQRSTMDSSRGDLEGHPSRAPARGRLIPIPSARGSGWQLSADASWWVHSSESNGGYGLVAGGVARSRAMGGSGN